MDPCEPMLGWQGRGDVSADDKADTETPDLLEQCRRALSSSAQLCAIDHDASCRECMHIAHVHVARDLVVSGEFGVPCAVRHVPHACAVPCTVPCCVCACVRVANTAA